MSDASAKSQKSMILEEFGRVLKAEASSLERLPEFVLRDHGRDVLRVVELLQNCAGRVVTTGIGKSGIVARKAAATFASTGTPSMFMHPSEALHGDLGMLSALDMVVIFGKSGESQEISALLPSLKQIGVKVIAITARPDSTLGRAADAVLWANVSQEACPHDLVPTSSTLTAIAVSDALALTLMKLRDFRPEHYAQIHPGGALGYRLNYFVRDLMIPLARHPALDPTKSKIEDVIAHLGTVGLVLFSKDGRSLDGIMTDGDIRRALEKYKAEIFTRSLFELITPRAFTVDGGIRAAEALRFMEQRERPLNAVPVMDGDVILGVIRLHDLLRG